MDLGRTYDTIRAYESNWKCEVRGVQRGVWESLLSFKKHEDI